MLVLVLPLPLPLRLLPLLDAVPLWRMELRADVSAGALDVGDASVDEGLSVAAAADVAGDVESESSSSSVLVGEERLAVVALVAAGTSVAGKVVWLSPVCAPDSPVRKLAVSPAALRTSPVLFGH